MFVWGHTRTSLGYDIDKDLSVTMLRGLLRWGQERSGKGAWVFHRVGISLRGMRSASTHSPFSLPIPNILCQTFRMKKLTATICLILSCFLLSSCGVDRQILGWTETPMQVMIQNAGGITISATTNVLGMKNSYFDMEPMYRLANHHCYKFNKKNAVLTIKDRHIHTFECK